MLYEFKINLEPNVINLFTSDGTNPDGMKQLKEVLIPQMFRDLMQKTEKYSDSIIGLKNDSSTRIDQTNEYSLFDAATTKLSSEYFSVVAQFHSTGAILYSQEYLEITKIDAKNAINDLLHKFPELNLAQDYKNSEFSSDLNNKVGHGKNYIIHARKIKSYLAKKPFSSKITAYYDLLSEKLYIEGESEDEATASSVLLNKMMNSISNEHNLGKININPIFDAYKIGSAYNKVTFHFVYPNGISSNDSEAIFDKFKKYKEASKLPAAKIDLTLTASESEKFSADNIEAVGEEDGKFGYLDNITNNSHKILQPFIKMYHSIKEVLVDEDKTDKRQQ